MRLYKQLSRGIMTSDDDWHSWPPSSSTSGTPAPSGALGDSAHPRRHFEPGLGREEGEGAKKGGGHAHFSSTVSRSPEEGLSSSEEECSARMGARSAGGSSNSSYLEGNWEIGKLAFIILFLAVAGLSNWAVLAYTHDFVGREPLPDIVFSFVPEITIAAKFGDLSVTACLICLFLLIVFHQNRFTILRRVFFIAATLYSMRSVTLLATQLPSGYSDNNRRCREKGNFSVATFFSRWGEQTVRFGFQGEEDMLCGDMLFSGHTLVMMVCLLTVTHYLPTKWRLLRIFPYIFAYIGMGCMIVSRTHYTIDVVVAHWLATLIFASYHAYAESDLFMDRRQSVLHNYVYFRVVAWLEENIVPGRLDNVFVNPITEVRDRCRKEPRDVGHHKQVSVSSSSTFASPSV